MWCWNRCITETGWTSAELEISWPQLPPSPLSPHYLTHFKDAHLEGKKAVYLLHHVWLGHCLQDWYYYYHTCRQSHLDSAFLLTKDGHFFFSPTPSLPTMLFLFLSGSSYKHLLCESDKPYPKPQKELQPKATNRGRPWDSAQAGSHQAGIVFHMFWLKLVKL